MCLLEANKHHHTLTLHHVNSVSSRPLSGRETGNAKVPNTMTILSMEVFFPILQSSMEEEITER